MKLIRFLLSSLVVAIVLVLVLVLVAIAPPVQTWAAQRALATLPGLHGSLDSLSAGFGGIDVENLDMQAGAAALKLPSLQVRLPITAAVVLKKLQVSSLVARGWTLDLSRVSVPAGAAAPGLLAGLPAAAAEQVAGIFRGLLGSWKLPLDGSLDGVELDGDVLLAPASPGAPVRVHVTVTGGGMSAGHEGNFALEATAEVPGFAVSSFSTHGRLIVAMDSPRSVSRIEMKADLSDQVGPAQPTAGLSLEVSAARGVSEQTCTVTLDSGGRHIATLVSRYPEATRRLAGTWNVDLRDAEIGTLVRHRPLPSFAASGGGQFDFDTGFKRMHALGSLKVAVRRLGALAPQLDHVGAVMLETHFDLSRSGRTNRFEHLDFALAGARPVAFAQSLQAFDLNETDGSIRMADAHGDWLGLSVRSLPMEWLSGLLEQGVIAGSDAAGEFVVRADDGVVSLRSRAPLAASGVSVQRAGRTLGQGLDLSVSIAADCGPKGWQVQCAPLAVDSAGRRLATIEGKASRPSGAGQPVAIAGTWKADLEAMASQRAVPALGWLTGRTASGEFSASMAPATTVEAKLLVLGNTPGDSVAASVKADASAGGPVAFEMPIKITSGAGASDILAEGTWVGGKDGNWTDARLTGTSVELGHLRLVASPLAALGGVPLAVPAGIGTANPSPPAEERDLVPFWGDWSGHLAVAFDKLRTSENEFKNVGAVFDLDRGSIRMTGGRGGLGRHLVTNVAGTVSFDGTANLPYAVKAAAAASKIDAAALFPAPQTGQDPLFEGSFSVQSTLAGSGANLDDLLGRTQAEFRFTSTAGIVRLLKASVAEALPEPPSSAVSDTLDTMGSVVGTVFGVKKGSMASGKSTLSKNTDAVLNFTYQVAEIGYDQVTVTAVRQSDGVIRLAEIEMTAGDEHLKGSGQISPVKGQPLFKQPITVELQLGARGKVAELLSTAGLLSTGKDSLGYSLLNQPIRFSGTLEHIDGSQWNEMLVKAAMRKPDAEKKKAETAPSNAR